MKKRLLLFLAAAVCLSLLAACGSPKAPPAQPEPKAVKTLLTEASTQPERLEYIGLTDASAVYSLSFKNGGVLEQVSVDAGDAVKAGMLLASQQPKDLQLASDAAAAQVSAQQATLAKAQDAMAYSQKQLQRLESLHEAEALSDSEVEAARLDLQLRGQEVEAAREALKQAVSQQGLMQNALADSRLYSPADGVVVSAPFEAGELVGDGIPVVVVRSGDPIVRIGLAQRDLDRILPGTKAEVSIDGVLFDGSVSTLSQTPDPQTRTYPIEVTLKGYEGPMGAVARVTLLGAERTGVRIPVEAVQAGTVSYVYLVQDGKVRKQEITEFQTDGAWIFTNDVPSGVPVITEGMKRVQPGDPVQIVKGGN